MLAKYAVAVVQDGNTPSGKRKTSDFLRQNIRTFYAKPPYFYLEKSEVFVFSAEKTQKSREKGQKRPWCGFCNIPDS